MRKINSIGIIINVLSDPNRTAKIGLVFYYNGLLSYILLSENQTIGSRINQTNFISLNDNPAINAEDYYELNIGHLSIYLKFL